VKNSAQDENPLSSQLKQLITARFRLRATDPETISDHGSLASLGLDSLDMLELGICIDERFGVTIDNRQEATEAFASVASLAAFIQARVPAVSARREPSEALNLSHLLSAQTRPQTS
jgi:acyl carrier protein